MGAETTETETEWRGRTGPFPLVLFPGTFSPTPPVASGLPPVPAENRYRTPKTPGSGMGVRAWTIRSVYAKKLLFKARKDSRLPCSRLTKTLTPRP